MVDFFFFKTFKCGGVDFLSRQKETFFRKTKTNALWHMLQIFILWPVLFGKMQNVIV